MSTTKDPASPKIDRFSVVADGRTVRIPTPDLIPWSAMPRRAHTINNCVDDDCPERSDIESAS